MLPLPELWKLDLFANLAALYHTLKMAKQRQVGNEGGVFKCGVYVPMCYRSCFNKSYFWGHWQFRSAVTEKTALTQPLRRQSRTHAQMSDDVYDQYLHTPVVTNGMFSHLSFPSGGNITLMGDWVLSRQDALC